MPPPPPGGPPPPRPHPGPPPFQETTSRSHSSYTPSQEERHVEPVATSLAPLGELGYHFNLAELELLIYVPHDEQKQLSRYLDSPDWYNADDIKPLSSLVLGCNHPITVTCDQGFTEAIPQLEKSVKRIPAREKIHMKGYQETLVRWRVVLDTGKECVLRREWKDSDLATGILDFESFGLFRLLPDYVFIDKFDDGNFLTGEYTLKPKAAPTNTSETGELKVTPTNTIDEGWVVPLKAIEASDLESRDVKS